VGAGCVCDRVCALALRVCWGLFVIFFWGAWMRRACSKTNTHRAHQPPKHKTITPQQMLKVKQPLAAAAGPQSPVLEAAPAGAAAPQKPPLRPLARGLVHLARSKKHCVSVSPDF